MKKTLTLVIMALAVLLTQCRKSAVEIPSQVAPEGTTVSMTVTAGPGSKTDITAVGGITWSKGDKLYVGDGTKYVGYLTLVDGAGSATGTFSGDVTLTGITEGSSKTFHFFYLGSAERTLTVDATTVDVDFSSQEIYAEGGELKNASAQHVGYGTANGTVTNGMVTGINVMLLSKVAIARYSFTDNGAVTPYAGTVILNGEKIYNKMTVNFNANDFSFSGTEGHITLNGSHSERYVMLVPAGSEGVVLNFGGGASGTTTLGSGIQANKFYGRDKAIEVSVTPNVFSVSATTTVEFAPGNLYYDGTTDNKWKFEANQWDFRTYNGKGSCINGTYNKDGGTPTNDWGLFGWSGSDQTHYGKSTSTDNKDYSGATFKDWGDIADLPSAGEGKNWHTLSKTEWEYLLSSRSKAGNSHAYVTLSDINVPGLVILPDNSHATASDVTTTALVAFYGAVFLPASGDRNHMTVSDVGSSGNYWSNTPYESDGDCAYFMSFTSDNAGSCYNRGRCFANAVRLVR